MKLFTILLLLSCLISCGLRPQKSIDDRINEAIELQKNKQPEKAMAIYYQVLPEVEDLSKRSVICYNLGVMYLWDRVFDKAYDMLHQAYICDSILKDTAAFIFLLIVQTLRKRRRIIRLEYENELKTLLPPKTVRKRRTSK